MTLKILTLVAAYLMLCIDALIIFLAVKVTPFFLLLAPVAAALTFAVAECVKEDWNAA